MKPRSATAYFCKLGSYLLPLAVLELYLRGRASTHPATRFATALVLVLVIVYTAVGPAALTMSRWARLG